MQQSWTARYLDGRSAQSTTVQMTITSEGLQIQLPDRSVYWPYAELRLRQGHYAGSQVRLEHGQQPVEAIILPDTAFLEHLHRIAGAAVRHVHNPACRNRRPLWIALLAMATGLFLIVLYRWGVPQAAQLVANQVPVSWEEKLGQSVIDSFLKDRHVCTDPLVTKSMNAMVRRLNAALPEHPYAFTVYVVDDPMVNAFAAPGGHIVFFTGLLKAAENAEMVAGVLAHEMQHVVHRHVTQRLFADLSTNVLLGAAVGDAGQAMSVVMETARVAGMMQYSQAHEEEADRAGVAILKRADINPQGLRDFFTVIQKEEGTASAMLQYVSSHPATAYRIAAVEEAMGQRRYHRLQLPTNLSWQTMMQRCESKEK